MVDLRFATENSAGDRRIFDFDIGMTKSFAFGVEQDVNTLYWLLKPVPDLRRGNILGSKLRR